jgi:hypothetical protein
LYINDTDSSNFALLGLGTASNNKFNRLVRRQNDDGGFPTYTEREIKALRKFMRYPKENKYIGWTQSHLCVSAVTYYLLLYNKNDIEGNYIEKLEAFLVENLNSKDEIAYFTVNDTLQIPVANLFMPSLNSSKQGSITFPFESLTPGKYKIKLTCFDIHTNQGNLTFEFTVAASGKDNRSLQIYPNPMTERSTFTFLQEKRWTSYFYKLKIYSILGNQIVERSGSVPGSDSAIQTFSIDWSAEEKNKLDFVNYYKLELTYDTGVPFTNFSGRIGNIK